MARKFTSPRGSQHSRREEGAEGRERKRVHVPVLLQEVVEYLAPQAGEVVVDCTFGQGGHSRALKGSAKIKLISIDADPAAGKGVVEGNFGDLEKILGKLGVGGVDKVLFDLGWNRGQLSAGKGFSFLQDGPLNMSYGPSPRSGFDAAAILNTWSEKAIADALWGYGEERYARAITRAVVERREVEPFASTLELAELVRDSVPARYRHGRIHPATKTFQALRIAVNDELGVLDLGLKAAWKHLSCGGRIAVITFHSIEDRAVKRLFLSFAKGGEGKLLTKKPVAPSASEVGLNPSARSAKLRVIEKTCTH